MLQERLKWGLQSNRPFAAWGHVICLLLKLREKPLKYQITGGNSTNQRAGPPIFKIFKIRNRSSLWWFE